MELQTPTVITYNGKSHFICSFGVEIKIYTKLENSTNKLKSADSVLDKLELYEIHAFKTKFAILKILAYQDYYYLIGSSRYLLCKDNAIISETAFPVSFEQIYKIMLFKHSFVIIHDKLKFSLGTVNNYKLELDKSVTDNHYFNVLSCDVLNNKLHLLVSTFSKRFIISYETEGVSNLKSSKREVLNGRILVKRKDDFLVFDEVGMWQYDAKIIFIKEFANYKITSSIFNNNRTILFCTNGEVIVISNDNMHYTVGVLDCSISNVSVIDDVFLCSSKEFTYFMKITDKIEIIEMIGTSKNNRRLQSLKLNRRTSEVKFVTQKTMTTMKCLMQPTGNEDSNDWNNNLSRKERGNADYINNSTDINVNGLIQANIVNSSLVNGNLNDVDTDGFINNHRFQVLFNNVLTNSVYKKHNFYNIKTINREFIVNFERFSIFKGVLFNPILNSYFYNNSYFLSFTDKLVIYRDDEAINENSNEINNKTNQINWLKNRMVVIKIESQLTKFINNLALFYAEKTLNVINLNNLKKFEFHVNLYDYTIVDDKIHCIDIKEKLKIFEIPEFEDECEYSIGTLESCKYYSTDELELFKQEIIYVIGKFNSFCRINSKIDQDMCKVKTTKINSNGNAESIMAMEDAYNDSTTERNDYKYIGYTTDTGNENSKKINIDKLSNDSVVGNNIFNKECSLFNYLAVNGKVFKIDRDGSSLLFDLNKFIYTLLVYKTFLMISADRTYIYNLDNKKLSRVSINSFNAFQFNNKLYLCNSERINDFSAFAEQFSIEIKNLDIFNTQSLVDVSHNNIPIVIEMSTDQKNLLLMCGENKLEFEQSINTCLCKIRKNLLAFGIASIQNRTGRLAFVNKSNLKIHKQVEINDIPVAVCSRKNIVCAVLPTSILIYKLKYNRIIKKNTIQHDSLVKSVQFISKNTILIRNLDWTYEKINIKSKEIAKTVVNGTATPFVINGNEGYAIQSKLYISGTELHCNEEIADIYSLRNTVISVGMNGSIHLLKEVEDKNVKSLYDQSATVLME